MRIVGIMRGKGVPVTEEDNPRLDRTKAPAMALYFLDNSDTLTGREFVGLLRGLLDWIERHVPQLGT